MSIVGPAGATFGPDPVQALDQETAVSSSAALVDPTATTAFGPGGGVLSAVMTWPTLDAGDWGTLGRDPGRSGYNPNASGPTTDPDPRWIYEFENDDNDIPTVAADGLVFVSGQESLRAVDNDTGQVVWNHSGLDIESVAVSDGVVVTTEVAYSGDEIRAYDATTGTELWNETAFQADATVVFDGTLYATRGEYLYAFDLQAGGERWSVDVNEDVSNGLSAADGTLYATGMMNSRDYAVYALNASDGSERWRFEMEGPVSMHPVAVDGSVYVGAGSEPRDSTNGAYDPRFYRLNATDGHVEWIFDANTRPHGAAVADGFVYLAAGNTIHALDDATGERQWLHRLDGSLEYGLSYTRIDALAPAVADGVVYALNDRGHLVGLDGLDGTELWSYRLEGQATRPAVADDRVYVHVRDTTDTTTDYSRVYALEDPPFQFSGFSLSKTAVAPGEEFTATVTVENVDDESRTYNLSLMADPPLPVDWWALDDANGTLNPGESSQFTFAGRFNVSGSWNVSVKRALEPDAAVDPVTVEVVHPTRDDDWAQIDFDGGRSKYNPDTFGPKQHLQEVWNLTAFDDTVQPVISDGTVFVVQEPYVDGTQVEVVRGYDETTGALEWEFNVSAQNRVLAGSPTADNGTVYLYATPSGAFTSENVYDASVFALNASDGTLRWRHDTPMNYSRITNDRAPVVDDGLVYVAGARVDGTDDENASVLALDAGTGTTAWRYDVNGDGTTEAFYTVAVENGTLVASLHAQDAPSSTSYTDRLVAIDAANGGFQWSTSGLTVDLVDPPVVRNGTVYVVNESSPETMFALDLADGSQQWEFVPPDQSTETDTWRIYDPTVTDDGVYVRQMMLDSFPYTNELYRLDPATGDIVWNTSTRSLTTRFVVDGLFYGGDGQYTYIFDAETGEYYSRTDLGSRERGSVQALANGTMIVYADSTTPNDFRVLREGGIIEYTDLSVDQDAVTEDQNVTVTATVTNVGSVAREYDVNLDVAPDSFSSHYIWNSANREGLLQPGESATVTWVVELRERGDAVFVLRLVDDQDMARHMYDRAGSATVNVGDGRDGAVYDLGGPRDLAPDVGSWPTASYDAGNTGNASGNSAPTSVSSNPVTWWVNHSYEWTSGPTLANDTVFVGGYNGGDDSVYAYNATDGSLRWQYATSNDIEVPPVYAGGYLYAVASYGKVYQLNATTGERLWTFEAGDDGGISVVDNVVYVAGETSSENVLYALNATTREILWTFGKPSTGYGMATPAVVNGTVYVTHSGQATYAVDAATGVEQWSRPIASSGSSLHSPVVENGIVYVDDTWHSSTNANIYALDTADGSTLWSTAANVDGYTGSSPALANDTLYFTADGAIQAVNASSGDSRWTNTVCVAAEHSPVYADGVVYVPMSDSTIQAYDATTGDLVWRYDGYDGEAFSPAVVGGTLYATGLENSDYTYSLIALAGGATDEPKTLFDYSGLSVSSANVTEGEQVTISATVANRASTSCDYTAELSVDGSVVDSTSGSLGSSSYNYYETVEFDYSFASTGTYNVTIADLPTKQVTVTGPQPDIAPSRTSYDFGDVNESESVYAFSQIYVRNAGTAPLNVTGATITGPNASAFSVSTTSGIVQPGDVLWISTLGVQSSTLGTKHATLEIASNDTDTPVVDVALSATVVGPPEVDVSPTSVDFGDIEVGNTSTATVTVSNVGGSDLSFDGAQVSGTDAALYTVVGGAGTTTIPAGGTHDVTVEFAPVATGATSATLEIATDDADEGTVSVAFSGNGTITTANRPPVTVSDHYTVVEGEWLNVSAPGRLANDLDPDGDSFSASHHGDVDNGTLYRSTQDGSFQYRPDPGFTGTDSYVYRVRDDDGAYSSFAPVTIEVLPDPNREPVVVDDHYSVHAGEWLNVSGPGRLVNDYDPDGDSFSASHHGDVDHGTLHRSAQDGSFEYRADQWFTGTDSYVYRVQDEHGAYSNFGTVTIEVLPPRNREPVAVADTYSVSQGETLVVDAPGRLANDYDPDGDSFSASHHGQPSHGTLHRSAQDGSFEYTPDPGFTGTDSYVYRVRDDRGAYSSFARVTIEVVDDNREPVVVEDHYATLEDEWLNVSAPGRLANDYDPDGDSFSASHHGDVDNGTLHRSTQDGSFQYLPNQSFTGTDSYVYRVRDARGEYSTFETVSIEVIDSTATDPVAVADHYTVTEGESLTVASPGVLLNDLDPRNHSFDTPLRGSPNDGSLDWFRADGAFRYTPDPGFTGTDSFVYLIENANGNRSQYATVTIEVLPDSDTTANRDPTVVDDTYTVVEGEWLNVSAPGRLANDYDVDGDSFSASHHGDVDNGTLHRSVQDGTFQYRPNPGFTGTDSYVYRVQDEHGSYSNFGTVTIEVVPDPSATGNRAPVVTEDRYSVYAGEWLNVSAPGRLANDLDPDGDSFSASHHGDVDNGTLHRSAQDGSFQYRPDQGFTGTDSYVYRVRDEHGAYSNFARVTIEVLPEPNRDPVVIEDDYAVLQGETLSVGAPGRLANDYDPDTDSFAASHHGDVDHGTLTLSATDGSLEYTPDPGFTGVDSYVYRVRDDEGAYSNFETVTITVVDASTTGNADIAVATDTLDFGSVPAGTTETATFTVANVGDLNLTVDGATLSGPNASDFAVVGGNATAVLGYGGTNTFTVAYGPTAPSTANATLTVHSDDPDEPTVGIALSGESNDDAAPTIHAVNLTGASVNSSRPDGSVVYENETVAVEVDVTDAYSSIQSVDVTLDAASMGGERTVAATEDAPSGNWTAAVDLDGLAQGRYDVIVEAVDERWNSRIVETNHTVVVDRSVPRLSASATRLNATHANVTVTASEALRPGTLDVEVDPPSGSAFSVTMTDAGDAWNGTFALAGDGQYGLSASAFDLVSYQGADTATARFATESTVNNTITVRMQPSGLFVRFNTNRSVNNTFVTMTESKVPVKPLVRGQAGLAFLDAELGTKLTGNLTYATIGIPVNPSLLPSGADEEDVTFRYFNETRRQWTPVTTTIENVTLNGTTDRYWVATVTHFSTYGAVTTDTMPPSITSTSPTDGAELPAGTTTATLRVAFEDLLSGVETGETAVLFDDMPVTGDPATSITSDVVEFAAAGLTDGSNHEFEVTVQDQAGNVHTETVAFSVATAPSSGGSSGSPSSGGTSGSTSSGGSSGSPSSGGSSQPPSSIGSAPADDPESSIAVLADKDGFRVEVRDAAANELLSTAVTDGALGSTGVSVEHLSLGFASGGDHDLQVTGGPTPSGTTFPPAAGTAIASLTVPDANVTTATIRFSLTQEILTARDASVGDVRLYRLAGSEWVAVDLRPIDRSGPDPVFEATVTDLDSLVVATRGSDVSSPTETPATSTDNGVQPPEATPDPATPTVDATPSFQSPTETGTPVPDEQPTPGATGPGFGVVAALAALLTVVLLRTRL
ncbi:MULTISPECIES: PQQ-binding-like beta-propeller repeat protein [Salinibaculum]|uniref:outer membrane protein assembly factor BamB family protein n=1 Tax=Salinibaculum TaxID=2732368 RepID=UPI0030D3D91A